MLDTFVSYASTQLGLPDKPAIKFIKHSEGDQPSFGAYSPSTKELSVSTKNRHPIDVFRTVAHELVHHKQNGEGKLKDVKKAGSTGSDIENEANARAGVIMRDFARANPHAFKSSYVTEGINDPGLFKAVFMAGGSGSGKDFILNRVLDGHGLQEINSDHATEFLMKKNKLDLKMPEHERTARDIVRGQAKNTTRDRQRLALAGRKGIIINGTADDPKHIEQIKTELEKLGYATKMVFVNTSDHISKERNIERGQRGGREVPEDIRSQKWKDSQKAKEHFTKLFGQEHFHEIHNDHDLRKVDAVTKKKIMDTHQKVFNAVRDFTQKPHTNPESAAWMDQEAAKRGITKVKPVKPGRSLGTAKPGDLPGPERFQPNEIMQQAKSMGLQYYGFGRFGQGGKVTHQSKNNQIVPKQSNPTGEVVRESLDTRFTQMMEEGGAGEWGTGALVNNYRSDTPGEPKPSKNVKKEKTKITVYKQAKLDNSGLGPEYSNRGGIIGGVTGFAESIQKWALKESTLQQFKERYGDEAEVKLLQAAARLNESHVETAPGKKSVFQIMNSINRK